jgi:hypothetical protein
MSPKKPRDKRANGTGKPPGCKWAIIYDIYIVQQIAGCGVSIYSVF